ncbi:hypothetical protein Bbelb_154140 [Branchiostoma belcheri]|nr:hypothetical protein Bbelb_154140 [Branchiostoma belcheri]
MEQGSYTFTLGASHVYGPLAASFGSQKPFARRPKLPLRWNGARGEAWSKSGQTAPEHGPNVVGWCSGAGSGQGRDKVVKANLAHPGDFACLNSINGPRRAFQGAGEKFSWGHVGPGADELTSV